MQDCCFKGFEWNGTPTGHVGKLADNEAYIAGDNKDRAVLMLHDALGWELKNTRLVADHYAKEANATVYLPNFFDQSVPETQVSIEVIDGKAEMKMKEGFDFQSWFQRNAVPTRLPSVLSCARALRSQYPKLAAVGFCWGGLTGFHLASKEYAGLLDCVTICHPGTPNEDLVRQVSVPTQIIAPEYDPTFPVEMKEFCNREIPKLGVDYMYVHFPGLKHGFCTKCNPTKENEKIGLERAKNLVVGWLVNYIG